MRCICCASGTQLILCRQSPLLTPALLCQQEVQTTLGEVVRDNSSAGALDESVAAYVSGLAMHLINARDFASDTWTNKVYVLLRCKHTAY